MYFVIRDGLFTDSYTVHLKDLNIPSTICDRPDLSAGARPDDLGLEVTGQRIEPDPAVLVCRIAGEDRWCRHCACQGASCGTAVRRLAHEPCGWRPTSGWPPSQHVTRAHGDRRNGAIHRLEERSRRRTPGARAVTDLFHVAHLAGDALDECRGNIGQERHQRRGRPYRPHGDRHTGKNAQTAIRRYPGLLRPPPHHRRSHRSHQRPPRTPTRLHTRTCETSPTTPPEHSPKQEDSKPNDTPTMKSPFSC